MLRIVVGGLGPGLGGLSAPTPTTTLTLVFSALGTVPAAEPVVVVVVVVVIVTAADGCPAIA